ncbi:MAG: hypothetical protein H7Z16_03325 [Pyrinomonadaceae bacterium]|nr:hypothetical protein [Pyrinomonadaceae bacterium]
MQKEILEAHPSAKLRVYVVWFSMIGTDARSRWGWTGGVLNDARAVHFWDEKKRVGRFYAGKDPESDDPDVVWDAYYLYGPDAEWTTTAAPLSGDGATVRAEFDELKNELAPFLK